MRQNLVLFRGILSFLALCVAIPSFAANTATTPVPREEEGWKKRHESMNEKVKQGNVDLIFIGDSITHGWEGFAKEIWAEKYAPRNAVNLGISGDRTEHVLWRLENGNIAGISPKAAVIMIGTNNHKDNTIEEITEGIKAIVEKLKKDLPDTQQLLLGIFPREESPTGEFRIKLNEVNRRIALLADGEKVHYLDIGPVFLDAEGNLPKDIMPDALHPNNKGYQLWADAIEPKLSILMGEKEAKPNLDGYKPLFMKNLQGWSEINAKDRWFVDNGLLYTDGGEGGGWLSTDKEFTDFELYLEFRLPEGGNSGVFIRAPHEGDPAYTGIEIQVLDDYSDKYKELKTWQYCGSPYGLTAPKVRATQPAGAWQNMQIVANGRTLQVTLNGSPIVNANLDDFNAQVAEHPGVSRTGGHIGLQNHGARVEYRNIQLKKLNEK